MALGRTSYTVVFGKKPDEAEVSPSQIDNLMADAISLMTKMQLANTALADQYKWGHKVPSGQLWYSFAGDIVKRAKWDGGVAIAVNRWDNGANIMWQIQSARETANALDLAIKACEKVQEVVKKGRASKIPPAVIVGNESLEKVILFSIKPPDKVNCDRCGVELTTGSLLRHRDNPTCTKTRLNKEMKANGLVPVWDDTVQRAMAKAEIPHEVRPVRYNMWAPAWAVKAANEYLRNKGYAGLSLADYLKRMKPQGE